jgi:hypothetical protein
MLLLTQTNQRRATTRVRSCIIERAAVSTLRDARKRQAGHHSHELDSNRLASRTTMAPYQLLRRVPYRYSSTVTLQRSSKSKIDMRKQVIQFVKELLEKSRWIYNRQNCRQRFEPR